MIELSMFNCLTFIQLSEKRDVRRTILLLTIEKFSVCVSSNKNLSVFNIFFHAGCCYSKGMRNCCWFSLALGLLFLILGLVGLFAGPSVLQAAILKTMALEPESDRYPHVLTQTALDDDNKICPHSMLLHI